MKTLIYQFVRQFHVSVILSNKVYNGLLDYYFLDWVDNSGIYYSLFAPCNETQVFTHNLCLIGGGVGSVSLAVNLRTFPNKAEWVSGRWDAGSIEQFNTKLKEVLNSIPYFSVVYGGFHLDKVFYALHPNVQIIFSYSFQDDYAGCFSVVWGQSTCVRARNVVHKYFLEEVLKVYGMPEVCHIDIIDDETR